MKANKDKATWILLLVSVSFFASYPYQHTFWGGLLAGGFGAAMIGGLADWFAVSALFRRPLGIPYRTAIVPRNRERIFHALASMVEEEILMKENIKKRLQEYDTAGLALSLLSSPEGQNVLKRVLYLFFKELLKQAREEELKPLLDEVLKSTLKKMPLSPYVLQGGRWLTGRGYHEKFLDILLDWLMVLAGQKKVRVWLAGWFAGAIRQYEKGKGQRALFDMLVALSPEEVAGLVQKRVLSFLEELKQPVHPMRRQALAWFQTWLENRSQDPIFLGQLEAWKEQLVNRTSFGELLAGPLAEFLRQTAADTRQSVRWLERVLRWMEEYIKNLEQDEKAKARLDREMKHLLSSWLDAHHREIGTMVLSSLEAFTNEKLVEFVESKAGNDLQMIRINGSVVGGLTGMVLYLATFWL